MNARRPRHRSPDNRGFTFAELLAAMLFMAIVIPVAVKGITLANRAGVIADRTRTAAQLADNLLTGLIETDEWESADNRGDFSPLWPDYQWELIDEDWYEDTVHQITIVVLFTVQEQIHYVQLSALAEESSEVTSETEAADETEETTQ